MLMKEIKGGVSTWKDNACLWNESYCWDDSNSQVLWLMPVVLVTQEAEAKGSLELTGLRSCLATQ
jgi:hypothetical protein